MIAFANNYKNCLYLQPKSPTQTDITDSIPNFRFLFYNIRRVVEEFQVPVINLSFDEQLHEEQEQNGHVSDGYDSYNANNTSESDGYDTYHSEDDYETLPPIAKKPKHSHTHSRSHSHSSNKSVRF